MENNFSILHLQGLPVLPPRVLESPLGESQLNPSPFSCSSWDIPPVPAPRAARAMPRKELGMAGSNSGSCDSMASTASNHSQRVSNPGGASPTRPSELREDLGQISARICSSSVLWRRLEALRQHQEQINPAPKRSQPTTCVQQRWLLQGLLWGRTGSWRGDPLPGGGILSLEMGILSLDMGILSLRWGSSPWSGDPLPGDVILSLDMGSFPGEGDPLPGQGILP